MKPEQIKTLKKFVNDPEWDMMKNFIAESLSLNIDIRNIDLTKDSNVILAEVVTRKTVAEKVTQLFANFENIKNYDTERQQKKALK